MQSAKDFAKQKVFFQTSPSQSFLPTSFFHLFNFILPFLRFTLKLATCRRRVRCENCIAVSLKAPRRGVEA